MIYEMLDTIWKLKMKKTYGQKCIKNVLSIRLIYNAGKEI